MSQCHFGRITKSDASQKQQETGADQGKGDISPDSFPCNLYGGDHCTYADHDHQIKDIGTDDITDRKLIVTCDRSRYTDRCLGERGSHCYDGKTDDDGRNMQSLRYTGASFYEKVRTFNQQYKTDYKEYKNKGKRGIVNKFLHVFLLCVIHYSVVSRKLCDDKYRQR